MTQHSLNRLLGTLRLVASSKKMPFYAVARGHKPGIYETWPECQSNINGYAGARYKKFATETEAKVFIQENSLTCPLVDRREPSVKENNIGNRQNGGQLSPTLLEMKASMKHLQKELSELRTRFEKYVEKKDISGSSSGSKLPPTSSAPGQKRKHSDDSDDAGEDQGDETAHPSGSKKLSVDAKKVDRSKFNIDSDDFLIVYTDGACWMNGKQGAKAGIGVYFGPDHPLNVSDPVKGRATNNNAEIQAATCALELAHASGFTKVAVHTDSQFMINCAASWMKNWKKKGWVKSDGEPVKNKEELIVLDEAMEGLAVKWVHVKGHSGHEGNEEADRLARQGAKLYQSEG